ncbi:hypothetical protein, partial [Undibacterium sp. CY21W]|uniref:hypothetical protein n=1 Tax=Undibacterium sp. CY21W TaxID=2762293 RepID=UPI001C9ACBBB
DVSPLMDLARFKSGRTLSLLSVVMATTPCLLVESLLLTLLKSGREWFIKTDNGTHKQYQYYQLRSSLFN